MPDVTPAHIRALANAGCGKTELLGLKFLWLVLQGHDPTKILATTFTRKAAGEMRGRVLTLAARAVLDGDVDGGFVENNIRFQPEVARTVLWKLVDQERRLRISTMDAWMGEVAAANPAATRLPAGTAMATEAEAVALDGAAAAALLDHDGALALLDAIAPSGRAMRLTDELRSSLGAMLETWLDSRDREMDRGEEPMTRGVRAWWWPEGDGDPPAPGCSATEVARLLQAIRDAAGASGNPVDQKALASLLRDAADADRLRESGSVVSWAREVLASTGVQHALSGSKKHGNNATPLSDGYVHAVQELGSAARAVASWHVGRLTGIVGGLMERFAALRDAEMRQRGVVDFDAVTRGVGAAFADGPISDFLFRMDGALEHILLDEFQDTSVSQWRVLRPLVAEACADGNRHVLVVGDVKQAIYGWRRGDAAILQHLPTAITAGEPGAAPAELTEVTLAQSFRSGQRILDAVDRVVAQLDRLDPQPHAAALRRNSVVKAHVFAKGRDLQVLLEVVREIREQRPGASLAVLARNGDDVHRAALALREAGIPASAMAGGMLLSSVVVAAILDMLRFASCPTDTLALANVAMSPLVEVAGLEWLADVVDGSRTRFLPGIGGAGEGRDQLVHAWLHRQARRVRSAFAEQGLAVTLERWAQALAVRGLLSEADRPRLRRLLEAAAQREADGPVDIARFERDMAAVRADESASDGVQVMTVHGAKGLQWDAVVGFGIPTKAPQAVQLDVKRDANGTGPARVLWHPKKGTIDPAGEMQSVVTAQAEESRRESQALLYVMLTRARYRLDVLLEQRKEVKGDGWDRAIATAWGIGLDAPGTFVVSDPVEPWQDVGVAAATAVAAPTIIDAVPAPKALGIVRRAPRASLHPEDGTAAAPREQAADPAASRRARAFALLRGTVLHRAAQSCLCSDGWDPSPGEQGGWVAELAQSLGPAADGIDLGALVRESITALRQPAMAGLLRSPAANGEEGAVWTELRFAEAVSAEGGGAALREGAIDRLVAFGREGAWVRAEVIDFKTDAIGPDRIEEDLAAAVAGYRNQMEVYRSVAARILRIPGGAAGVGVKLAFTALDRVVSLPH